MCPLSWVQLTGHGSKVGPGVSPPPCTNHKTRLMNPLAQGIMGHTSCPVCYVWTRFLLLGSGAIVVNGTQSWWHVFQKKSSLLNWHDFFSGLAQWCHNSVWDANAQTQNFDSFYLKYFLNDTFHDMIFREKKVLRQRLTVIIAFQNLQCGYEIIIKPWKL